MKMTATTRVLLGPQSPVRNVGEAVTWLPDGPLAVISAGWQEAEGDLDELAALVDRPLRDLHLYERVETVTNQDSALADAIRERQSRLVDLQRLYRLRLKQLSIAARRVFEAEGDSDLLAAEQRHAIAQLRALDRHHLHRSQSIWDQFSRAYSPDSHSALAQHVSELNAIIGDCAGVIITGGNIAVLINRMRLLGVSAILEGQPIMAWSAGVMALGDRIVLFHDRSPEGRRDAEVLGAGCGLVPGYVFLPDTERRLRSGDRLRVGLMSRRFAPDVCVALDNGTEFVIDDDGVRGAEYTRELSHNGRLVKVRAA
jgi:hypothetical protein